MSGIPSIFKQFRPRGFNYTPMYYDAAKEAREERERRIKAELGIKEEGDNKEYKSGIVRGSMSGNFNRPKAKVQRWTLVRLIVIGLILFLIAYFIFYF